MDKYCSGHITNGRFSNSSSGGGVSLIVYTAVDRIPNGTSACASTSDTLTIDTSCSASDGNSIEVGFLGYGAAGFGTFNGVVDCSQREKDSTQSSSSSTTTLTTMTGTSTQDRDGDGILDANDNCPNLPNTRCYKEDTTRK